MKRKRTHYDYNHYYTGITPEGRPDGRRDKSKTKWGTETFR